MRELYPVTIIKTRYGGVYEGGKWAAFLADPDDVPVDAISDDVTCAEFWHDAKRNMWAVRSAVGKSPFDALRNLEQIAPDEWWIG